MTIKFGIAPINWTNDDDPKLGEDISLDQCLREMREAGYIGCELGNKFSKDINKLRNSVEEYNLQITTDWIGTRLTVDGAYEKTISDFKQRVIFLKKLGVKALKVCECGHSIQQTTLPILHNKVIFTKKQWRLLLGGLKEMGEIAAEQGLYLAYHQHLGTGVENEEELDRLMAGTDPDLLTLLPDTGHLFVAGMDPLKIFERYHDRIKYVHLKDVRKQVFAQTKESKLSFMDAVRAGLFTVPGDGDIDFAGIFELLKNKQFSGWLIVEAEQDPAKANPFQLAKKSREYLRHHFNC